MAAADKALCAFPKWAQYLVIALTLVVILMQCITQVPTGQMNISDVQERHGQFGAEDYADTYEAKVVINDPWDMYTKEHLDQTKKEHNTWSKEASSPYPPICLLAIAGLYLFGEYTGLGFYGTVLLLVVAFMSMSVFYFLKTRWYLFPILYLNFTFLAKRFFYSQNTSYLLLFCVVMIALLLARKGNKACHPLMALAVDIKFMPVYYVKNLLKMRWYIAAIFVAVLLAGLVLPYFIWDNYLYIYTFQGTRGTLAHQWESWVIAGAFSLLLWYVETRMKFDDEDKIGWSMVPFGMFMMIRCDIFRTMIMMCIIPDKRGWRNVVAAIGLTLGPIMMDTHKYYHTVQWICLPLPFLVMLYYLVRIGWKRIWADLRHPLRTAKAMLVGERGKKESC